MNLASALIVCLALQSSPAPCVLRGLDPVELCEGREVQGKQELALEHFVHRYAFASEATREEFLRDPSRYEIRFGGACGRMGPLSGACDTSRFAVWEGQLYVFASDACRSGFLADPRRHLEADDAVPERDAEAEARGKQLLERVLAAHGGAARIDGWKSLVLLHEEHSTYQGRDVVSGSRLVVDAAGRVRFETFWDTMRTVRVAAPERSYTGRSGDLQPLHASQRALLEKDARRLLPVLLRARTRPDFVALALGSVELEGASVEELSISFAGATSVLGVDPASGKVVRQRYVGRPGVGPNGAIVLLFSDFREVGGLLLPFTQRGSFDGKPSADQSFTWTAVELDTARATDFHALPQ